MGPYYQAFPEGGSLTIYEDDEARTYDEIARWSKKDAEAWPKWNAWLAGLADVMGPLLTRVPPTIGSHSPVRPRRPRPAGLEEPRRRRPHGRRHHPADEHEHRRPARRLVRVAADQGRAGGQRRDRHLGRSVRAGHGVRDGAPLDRRRRRRRLPQRAAGFLGLPRGRHGRGLGRDRAVGARRSAPRSAPAPASSRSAPATAASPAWCSRTASELTRAARRHQPAPQDRLPRPPRRAPSCPTTSSATSSGGTPARGVVKINLALAELPNFTADPSDGHRRAPHRVGGDVADHGVHRARVPGRPRGPRRAAAVQRRRHPDDARQDAQPRRHAHLLDVHPVRPARVERGAAHRGARGLRRPADRPLRPGGARLRRLGHRTATSSGRTRCRRSTA